MIAMLSPSLLSLPPDIFRLFYEYLTIKDIGRLDQSIANKRDREVYKTLLKLSIKILPYNYMKLRALLWAFSRGIQLEELCLDFSENYIAMSDFILRNFPKIKKLHLYSCNIPADSLMHLIHSLSFLKNLHIDCISRKVFDTLDLRNIEQLSLRQAWITDNFESLLSNLSDKLSHIALSNCAIPPNCLELLTSHFPHLKSIKIRKCRSAISIFINQGINILEDLELISQEISIEEVSIIAKPFPNLKYLNLSGSRISDTGLSTLISGTNLICLNLSNCTILTEDGIIACLEQLPKLQILTLPFISPIICSTLLEYHPQFHTWDKTYLSRGNPSELSICLTHLQPEVYFECVLSILSVLRDVKFIQLLRSQKLKITLSHSEDSTMNQDISLDFSNYALRSSQLQSIPVHILQNLSSLNISNIESTLSDDDLITIALHCKHLRWIHLPLIHSNSTCTCGVTDNGNQVTTLGLMSLFEGCRELEYLDLSNCHAMDDICLHLLIDSDTCPNLKYLSLSICDETSPNERKRIPPSITWNRM